MAKPPPGPHDPAKLEEHDIHAIKALAVGQANDVMQKHALNVIVGKLARTYDLSYRPGDENATAFAEGKRFVGLQLVRLVNMKLPE